MMIQPAKYAVRLIVRQMTAIPSLLAGSSIGQGAGGRRKNGRTLLDYALKADYTPRSPMAMATAHTQWSKTLSSREKQAIGWHYKRNGETNIKNYLNSS
jgi:hypothetical protein